MRVVMDLIWPSKDLFLAAVVPSNDGATQGVHNKYNMIDDGERGAFRKPPPPGKLAEFREKTRGVYTILIPFYDVNLAVCGREFGVLTIYRATKG